MYKFLLIFYITLSFASCKNVNPKKTESANPDKIDSLTYLPGTKYNDPNPADEAKYKNSGNGYKKVTNERYGFSFEIPQEWKATDKSNNGDGFYIELPGSKIDIRVYGENTAGNAVLKDMETATCDTKENFLFADGTKGLQCITKNETYFYYDKKEKRITLYVNADKSWMDTNKDAILRIAKSISVANESAL